MKIKPVKTSDPPNYPDKYAAEVKKALLKSRLRWLGAGVPLAAGIIAAAAANAQVPGKPSISKAPPYSITDATPSVTECVVMGDMPIPLPTVTVGVPTPAPTATMSVPTPAPTATMGVPTPAPTDWVTAGVPPIPVPALDFTAKSKRIISITEEWGEITVRYTPPEESALVIAAAFCDGELVGVKTKTASVYGYTYFDFWSDFGLEKEYEYAPGKYWWDIDWDLIESGKTFEVRAMLWNGTDEMKPL